VKYGIGDDANLGVRFVIAALAIAGIVAAVTISNKRSVADAVQGAVAPAGTAAPTTTGTSTRVH
jgi:hypothetical protein